MSESTETSDTGTDEEATEEVESDGEGEGTPVEEPEPKTTVTVNIDGVDHEAPPGQKVIDAAEDAGTYIPRFCYHHRMTPVGMCRQCLVEIEGPRGSMLTVSCMMDVAEGQVVRTQTDEVKRAQEGVLELLLANHPLDCPVCDKGGECPLQDQAFANGPGESRFIEEKRHFEKPIPISGLVDLDRERCVLCDRCTRFADEVAGDKLINFTHRGNNTQILTFPDEPFVSYFSGNTVQLCPVGALTARPYRFKARPWDLTHTESTCTTCSVGCRTVIQSSQDELVRYEGVDSDTVNWSWLCDRGRFGFQSVHSDERLERALARTADGLVEVSWNQAIGAAVGLVQDALDAGGPESVAVLGGARGSNEDAWMWSQLADAIGTPHRDAQLGDGLPPELLELPRATINEAASASTIVLLGPDIKEELPVLYLRLRDAADKHRSRILELSPTETGLTRNAWRSVQVLPGDTSAITEVLSDSEVAEQMASGDVVVVAGRGNLAESETQASAALNAVLDGCPEGTKVLPALRRGNVVGALSLGMRPAEGGEDGLGILRAAASGRLECLVLVGSDPLSDCPDADLARKALAGARRVISLDTHLSASAKQAHVVLAALTVGEKNGTTTNIEGRVQTINQRVTAHGVARPDWMIALELAGRLGHRELVAGVESADDITRQIADDVPAFAGITRETLDAAVDGIVAARAANVSRLPADGATPEVRNSYDFRLVVSRKLYDQAVGTVTSPALAQLIPGSSVQVHPLDLERLGVADGTDIKLIAKRGTIVLPVRGNESVPRGIAWAPFNQPGTQIGDALDAALAVNDVRLETL